MFLDQRLPDRFWDKVHRVPLSSCWLWVGSGTGKGHGNFCVNGLVQKAHRFAYKRLVGAIPPGLLLDHRCRCRCCVNPAHLEPVTSIVNTMRGIGPTALNAAKTKCKRGHKLAGDNLRLRKRGRLVERVCRECERQRRRKAVA